MALRSELDLVTSAGLAHVSEVGFLSPQAG